MKKALSQVIGREYYIKLHSRDIEQTHYEQPTLIQGYKAKNMPRRLTQVLDYIHNSLDKKLSLESMAQLAHLSTCHFARLFKLVVGVSPHQYIINVRIDKAKNLLQNTFTPISLIALEVGYSPNHFIQVFKRWTQHTPSQYRNLFK